MNTVFGLFTHLIHMDQVGCIVFDKFTFVFQIMENLKIESEIQRELNCMTLRSLGSVDLTLPGPSHRNQVQEFFLLMAICNTVVVSLHPHEDIVSNVVQF